MTPQHDDPHDEDTERLRKAWDEYQTEHQQHEHHALVRVGPKSTIGLVVPRSRRTRTIETHGGHEYEIAARLSLRLVDGWYPGRYEAISFSVTARGVESTDPAMPSHALTPAVIRSLPIAELLSKASSAPPMLRRDDARGPLGDLEHQLVEIDPDEGGVYYVGERRLLKPDQEIAASWVAAKLLGRDANTALVELLGVSSAAVAQRVRRLRQQGMLPPTRQGARR